MYSDQIFIAPSGVQKERIKPDDLFVQDLNGTDIIIPKPEKKLSKSQCTPIFMCSFTGILENWNFFFLTNNLWKKFRKKRRSCDTRTLTRSSKVMFA